VSPRDVAMPAAAFLAAAALGWFGSGLRAPTASTGSAVDAADPVASRPDLSGCGLEDLERDVADQEVANEALYQETRALAEENEVEGVRLSWPEELPRDYEEPALRARLDEALAAVPEAALVELDCAQYPCIAVLASFADEEGRLDEAHERFIEGLGVLEYRTGGVVEELEWFSLRYAALGEGELDQGEKDLLRQRVDDVAARSNIEKMRSIFGGGPE